MPEIRNLPQVDRLSRDPGLAEFPEPVRIRAARRAVDAARQALERGETPDAIALAISFAKEADANPMAPVINLSGVVLHTGLGRAKLAPSVARHIAEVASRPSLVEFELEEGSRGDRQLPIEQQLDELLGVPGMIVNNAAGAVLLTLAALAGGKEVLLSRGQMVEIGGSFRMPDIIQQSGCRLVEVGCTNKTHLSDYARAVGEGTGAILRCHTSNYKVVGFASTPTIRELASIAKERGVPLVDDQGTGALVETSRFGMPKQPTVQESIAQGADVTLFSGDKMMGGPQAGFIVARRELLDRIKSHPLARALRVDKLTLAGVSATLQLYLSGRELEIPTLAAFARPLDEVRKLAEAMREAAGEGASVEPGVTEVGSGSAPNTGIQTYRLGIKTEDPGKYARLLRLGEPHIISRIEKGQVWLDPRTLDELELESVLCRLREMNT